LNQNQITFLSALKHVVEKESMELEIFANNKTLEDGRSVLQVLSFSIYQRLASLLIVNSLRRQQALLSGTSRVHTELTFLVHGFYLSRIAPTFCL
jgi:hypothetical protein